MEVRDCATRAGEKVGELYRWMTDGVASQQFSWVCASPDKPEVWVASCDGAPDDVESRIAEDLVGVDEEAARPDPS